jgi:hypothetical protein
VGGGDVVARGRAPRDTDRVALQLRRAGRWETVRVRKLSADGRYRLAVPTGWWGRREVRVVARTPGRPPSYSRIAAYAVTPGYRPAGKAAQHALDQPGYRWDPCRTIRWKYNPVGQRPGVLGDAKRAFEMIAAATGLRFRYAGGTGKAAMRHTPDSAGADILISWSTPERDPLLEDRRVGASFSTADVARKELRSGAIVLDRSHRLRRGFATRGSPTWGQILVHEIGHVVGLGHTEHRDQVMFGTLRSSNHRLGAGDLAGLRKLGADRPCIRRR